MEDRVAEVAYALEFASSGARASIWHVDLWEDHSSLEKDVTNALSSRFDAFLEPMMGLVHTMAVFRNIALGGEGLSLAPVRRSTPARNDIVSLNSQPCSLFSAILRNHMAHGLYDDYDDDPPRRQSNTERYQPGSNISLY